jgi:hypothetical protein
MINPNPTICIVGFGIAGQLLILELQKAGVPPPAITILDETFLGGALMTDYPTVISNTPWIKTKTALEQYQPYSAESIARYNAVYQDAQCMPVRDIADACFQTAWKVAEKLDRLTTKVRGAEFEESSNRWNVEHTHGTLRCNFLFMCQGSLEKQLSLDLPTVPLSIALDKQRLASFVSAEKDKVAVFGIAHSGTVLLDHLHALNIPTVGIYNTPTPFQYARDGHYDGIKECTEQIADRIRRGEFSQLQLVSWNDPLAIHRTLKKVTKCIYSVGFSAKPIGDLTIQYDPNTAKLNTASPNCYGYGIAFPGITEIDSKKYSDVSVGSFQQQIQRTLPAILQRAKEEHVL